MINKDVQLSEDEQFYVLGGNKYYRLTHIISDVLGDNFGHIPFEVLERKRVIGTAAHKATELFDEGILDEGSIDEEVSGYLNSWKEFHWLHTPKFIEIEATAVHGLYGTRIDRLMAIDGELFLSDIKTSSSVGIRHAIQLGGQAKAIDHMGRVSIVQLKKDAKLPKFVEFDVKECIKMWDAVYESWLLKNGLKKYSRGEIVEEKFLTI